MKVSVKSNGHNTSAWYLLTGRIVTRNNRWQGDKIYAYPQMILHLADPSNSNSSSQSKLHDKAKRFEFILRQKRVLPYNSHLRMSYSSCWVCCPASSCSPKHHSSNLGLHQIEQTWKTDKSCHNKRWNKYSLDKKPSNVPV